MLEQITDEIMASAPLEPLLHDEESISEVMVNGPRLVYIERAGKLELTNRLPRTTTTSCGSSTGSSPRSVAAWTSRRRWSTPA